MQFIQLSVYYNILSEIRFRPLLRLRILWLMICLLITMSRFLYVYYYFIHSFVFFHLFIHFFLNLRRSLPPYQKLAGTQWSKMAACHIASASSVIFLNWKNNILVDLLTRIFFSRTRLNMLYDLILWHWSCSCVLNARVGGILEELESIWVSVKINHCWASCCGPDSGSLFCRAALCSTAGKFLL